MKADQCDGKLEDMETQNRKRALGNLEETHNNFNLQAIDAIIKVEIPQKISR